eukprot:gene5128-3862_t
MLVGCEGEFLCYGTAQPCDSDCAPGTYDYYYDVSVAVECPSGCTGVHRDARGAACAGATIPLGACADADGGCAVTCDGLGACEGLSVRTEGGCNVACDGEFACRKMTVSAAGYQYDPHDACGGAEYTFGVVVVSLPVSGAEYSGNCVNYIEIEWPSALRILAGVVRTPFPFSASPQVTASGYECQGCPCFFGAASPYCDVYRCV